LASETVTVRSLLAGIQREVLDTDLQPDRAAELLTKLTALYANVLAEVTRREMAFNEVLLRQLDDNQPAAKAKIRAQATDEYDDLRQAKDAEKSTLQLIQSLKLVLRMKNEEMRLG
jgi:hypothetical protein